MSNMRLHLRSFLKEIPPVRAYKRKKNRKKIQSALKMEQALDTFACKEMSEKEKALLVKDMKEKAARYGFSYDEYFLLNLYGKPEEQVKEYISDYEHVEIAEKMNKAKNQAIFDDKALTFRYFGKYYRRECTYVKSSANASKQIRVFANNHSEFIVKPIEKAGGAGIEIVHAKNEAEMQNIISKVQTKYKYGVFLEELIQQVPELKKLHPSSVNTVRVPTIRVNNQETVIFHPFLRVGRGGAVVDNAGSGGIICVLDEKTGRVISARDERGNVYSTHPQTGESLVGFLVPQWEDAVKFAKVLAEVCPSNRYTGWDLALTEQGWVMVEGNSRGQFIWQYSSLQGCRSEVNRLFKKMGIRYDFKSTGE